MANELGWKQASTRVAILTLSFALAGCVTIEPMQHYQLEGTVVSVEANSHEVTVKHKEISGFMKAMTMSFAVRDEANLAKLKPGDTIRAEVVVDRNHHRVWLEHIQVTSSRSGTAPATSN